MTPRKERRASDERAIGEYLIAVQAGGNIVAILEGLQDLGVHEMKRIGTDLFLLKVERDPGPEAMQQRGRTIGAIRYIEPNYTYRTQ